MKTEIQEALVRYSDTYPCPYFEDRRESTIEYLVPDKKSEANYHKFLARGYRRMGKIFYRNACHGCSSCRPLRLIVEDFSISKSQKRTLSINKDIKTVIREGTILTPEKINLYEKYVNTKHPDDKTDEPHDAIGVLSGIHYGYANIIEVEYFIQDKLIAVGVVDVSEDALSSNYFYYDTDYLKRRLGVFSILQEIELARYMKRKYYYLGFYIRENPKMSYKNSFRPNEMLINNSWERQIE